MVKHCLVAALVMTIMPCTKAFAQNNIAGGATSEFNVQNPDGEYIIYKIQINEDKQAYQLDIKNLSTGEITTLQYDHGIAITSKTIPNGYTTQVSKVDYSETIKLIENTFTEDTPAPCEYRPETKCVIPTLGGNQVWYQIGDTAPDVGYMLYVYVNGYLDISKSIK